MTYRYSHIDTPGPKMVDQRFCLFQEEEKTTRVDLIIPDCTPGLMYIHEGGFWRQDQHSRRYLEAGKVFLFGQKTQSVEYQFDASGLLAYGWKLGPASLYALFGIAADEITDSVIELNTINSQSDYIADLLMHSGNSWSLGADKEIPALLKQILQTIHQSRGTLSIQDISQHYRIGYKQLQRLFRLHVGVTPKLYARIIRFNHSVRMGSGNPDKLTDVAYQSGFFDQNHFIKEIKRFTGKVPSELFAASNVPLEKEHLAYLQSRGY